MANDHSKETSLPVLARVKKPYTPPTMTRWGTLSDITQSTGWYGNSDGGRKFPNRTN